MPKEMTITWPDDLNHDSRCPIGKHKGKEMKDVPVIFLSWAYDQFKNRQSTTGVNIWLVARYYKKYHLDKNQGTKVPR